MAKRANNEGSMRQRPDGLWEARVTVNGKQRSLYGKTRADVSRKMREALRDTENGIPLADERMTVSQYLSQWLETSVKPSVRPNTYESYAMHVRLHLTPALGRLRLSHVTPQHVQDMMNKTLARGLSPNTVLHIRATLRKALGQAVKWGMIQRNVATLVDPPKLTKHVVEPMSAERAGEILAAVRGHRLEGLFVVALTTGLRQGEALGLKWSDVDLDTRLLSVRQAMQRINGAYQLSEPKSPRSRRTISIPAVAVDALRQHRARQHRERLAAGDTWHDMGLVFSTSLGTPMDGPNVTHIFQKLLKEAGLPHYRFHDLRHGCATLLLTQGAPMRVVTETLGHSQFSLTMDTYAHVVPALQREAADRMDSALAGRVPGQGNS
ncbi:MAG: site-specific integrase [Ardenticatenales bacterium]|nr:site-specific integrase [Ardenticatenales bacterium]